MADTQWDRRDPAGLADDTWHSSGFRGARTRSHVVLACFALLLVAALITVALCATEASVTASMLSGGRATHADLVTLLHNVQIAAGWYIILLVPATISFLAWLSRTVENTVPLGAGTPRRSPRSSIGWWFVPFANLVVPLEIIRDLFARLATLQRRGKDAILLAWWIATIASFPLVALALGAAPANSDNTVNNANSQGISGICAFVVSAIGLALAIWLVNEIQTRAELRADELGLLTPRGSSATWPSPNRSSAASADSFVWPVRPGPSVTISTSSIPTPSMAPSTSGEVSDAVVFCPTCGRRRSADSRYCAGCGRDLTTL